MAQQTAVEWLVNQLDLITSDTNKYDDFKWVFEAEIEQAKAMERGQSISILTYYHNNLFLLPLKGGEAELIYDYIVDTNEI